MTVPKPYQPWNQPADLLDLQPEQLQQMPGIPGFQPDPDNDLAATAQILDLMNLLGSAYARDLDRQIKLRRSRGQKTIDLDTALAKAPFRHFFDFCVRYLTAHRPVQQFAADANIGFMLDNNVRVLLCPPPPGGHAGPGGGMQDAGDVGVTHGRSQPGLGGVVDDGGIAII